ncbi:hypothetical protein [Arthrobacter rhizosphaerae]|uniref:hypothetical protein n=1 Tax=Arthrobacter rhizosphaerae TaxID=2855490 RepID=UPI001FF1B5A5|nr:hypothetical protein [Arthrobacter rhizosphaerae]
MKKRELVSMARNHLPVPAMKFPHPKMSGGIGERHTAFGWPVGSAADFIIGLFPEDSEDFHATEERRLSW